MDSVDSSSGGDTGPDGSDAPGPVAGDSGTPMTSVEAAQSLYRHGPGDGAADADVARGGGGRTEGPMTARDADLALARTHVPDAAPGGGPASEPIESPPPEPAPDADRPDLPDELWSHVSVGGFNKADRPTGWHHRPDGDDPEGRRVPADAERVGIGDTGAYWVSRTQFRTDGKWVDGGQKSFFPDAWSEQDVRQVVQEAWDDPKGVRRPDRSRWSGDSRSGFPVEGFYNSRTGECRTAFPRQESES